MIQKVGGTGMGDDAMVLSGWKDIAGYLRRGLRTVQRWEGKGLPVRRPVPGKRSHVITYSEELDRWVRHRPHQAPPNHMVVIISRAKQLCEDARINLTDLRAHMQALREEMANLRSRRRKAS